MYCVKEHVDVALRRPGRFDQVVWMGLPDERGRADIFEHYLRGLCCLRKSARQLAQSSKPDAVASSMVR
jgi:ATP-dependent Zn protease